MDFYSKKINILFLINGFNIGGAEKNLLELVRRLNRNKYHIVVCSVGQGGPLQKEFEALGHRVVVFNKRFSFDLSLILKVALLMKQEKIDLLQTTLFYADVIGAFAARLVRVPIHISWFVNVPPDGTDVSRLRHRLTYRAAYKFVNTIVPVSGAVRDFLIEKRRVPSGNLHLIHYGVDTEKFADLKGGMLKNNENPPLNKGGGGGVFSSEKDIIIGTVARLTHQKGHCYLIEAAGDIVKRFKNIKFLLAGDGPLRATLESQVRKSGLSDHFQFLGFRTDINNLISSFYLFILPSLYEGLPNAVLEAMASAKPIVASSVDGTREAIVDGETGILVPPGDSVALAGAIIKLLDNPQLAAQMGIAARKRAIEHFSLDKEVRAFESLYDNFFGK